MLFLEVERDLLCKVLYLCTKNTSLFDGLVNFHENFWRFLPNYLKLLFPQLDYKKQTAFGFL